MNIHTPSLLTEQLEYLIDETFKKKDQVIIKRDSVIAEITSKSQVALQNYDEIIGSLKKALESIRHLALVDQNF